MSETSIVKPLEWVKPSLSKTLQRAETVVGIYRVWTHPEAEGFWYWQLDAAIATAGDCASEQSAKAYAQADYDSRIAPALSIDPASFQALKDENERLKKDRNIQKAHSALRGRILQEIRDRIGSLLMGLEDEGDRVYLGSTNDKDWLTEIEETIFEVDDEVWATLNREEADPYQDLYDLRVNRVPALECEIAAKDARIEQLASTLRAAEQSLEYIRVILIHHLDEPERKAFWAAVEARDIARAVLRDTGGGQNG